jgi:hypothetical protein
VSCGAADIATGKITEVPTLISANPISEPSLGEKCQQHAYTEHPSSTCATTGGEYRSTNMRLLASCHLQDWAWRLDSKSAHRCENNLYYNPPWCEEDVFSWPDRSLGPSR